MKLIVATSNLHKLREIREVFRLPSLELLGLRDVLPDLGEIEEDGDTFEANAAKKAAVVSAASGLPALADDSGLEVLALGGAPGVYSARYAGEPVDYAANNRKLLAALAGSDDRLARFRCVLALARPGAPVLTVDGRCEGEIIGEPRGANGFGYDPVFVPSGYRQTFAEMDATVKNAISHRGRALQAAAREWRAFLAGDADS